MSSLRYSSGGQRGAMSVVIAGLILPLLFIFGTLSLDLGTYYADQERVQLALDEVALQSSRFLPRVAEAQAAAQEYASTLAVLSSGFSATATSDAVVVSVRRTSPLTFARLVGFSDASLPLIAQSRVRATPLDVFVALDSAATLAPASGAPSWGSEVDWPAAQLFLNGDRFPEDLTGMPTARSLTQRCFNPAFSPLKRAAIGLVDYLGANSGNSVGVGVLTSDPLQPLRLIRGASQLPTLPVADNQLSAAQLLGAVGEYRAPEICLQAAEQESLAVQYRLPTIDNALPSRGDLSGRPAFAISPVTQALDPWYRPYLDPREVLWAQPTEAQIGSGNTADGIVAVVGELFRASVRRDRGGLVAGVPKVGILLLGDLPRVSGVRFPDPTVQNALRLTLGQMLSGMAGTPAAARARGETKLYLVLPQHPEVPAMSGAASELQRLLDEMVAQAQIPAGSVSFQVVYGETPEQARQFVVQHLALAFRGGVISRVGGI